MTAKCAVSFKRDQHGGGTVDRIVAYDKDGNKKLSKEISTAGQPYQLKLEADRTSLKADGKDLAFVTVSVVDRDGRPCPTATNQLQFKVNGEGTYRAACNGDATSLEMFHEPTMQLFSGKLVVLVQSTKDQGEINLTVTGTGLKKAELPLQSFH